jgi:hypothetical protein
LFDLLTANDTKIALGECWLVDSKGCEGLLQLGDGEVAVLDLVLVLFDIGLKSLEYLVVLQDFLADLGSMLFAFAD